MHVDQMEELDLDCDDYAKSNGRRFGNHALGRSCRRQRCRIRPRATSPSNNGHIRSTTGNYINLKADSLGKHAVWILDFDCCRDMTMDEAGVDQAWRALYTNDPY